MKIDIKTKIIPPGHRIWALHAGQDRRFQEDFRLNSAVFLDIPGFSAATDTFSDVTAVRQHLRMSKKVANYVRRQAAANPPAVPSRDPKSYSNSAGKPGFNSHVGNIITLYSEVSVGDLILVPLGDQYDPVLFGEVLRPFTPRDLITIKRYPREKIPFRAVRWLPLKIQKRDLSEEISRRLENPHAISMLHSKYSHDIYKLAYKTYSSAEVSKADFFGPTYSGRDPLEIIEAARLIKFYVSAYAAIKSGNQADLGTKPLAQIIKDHFEPELIQDITIEFTSPGKFTLICGTAVVCLLVAAAVAMSVSGVSYQEAIAGIDVINSAAAAGDPAVSETNELLNELINSIGEERYNQLKEEAQEAKAQIGLSTNAVVKK